MYVLDKIYTKAQKGESRENAHGSKSRETNLKLVSSCIVSASAVSAANATRKSWRSYHPDETP